MATFHINIDLFYKRVLKLYEFWANGPPDNEFCKTHALTIAVGVDEQTYSKSTAFQVWLFGYELPDSIIVATRSPNTLHFLATRRKIDFLKQIENSLPTLSDPASIPKLRFHLREKEKPEAEKAFLSTLIDAIKSSNQGKGKVYGEFRRDKFEGDFYHQWLSALRAATRTPEKDGELESVDVSNAFAVLLAVKDEAEIELLRRAAAINSKFYNSFLKEHIIKIIDEDKRVKHSKITEQCDENISNEKYLDGAKPDAVDLCYPPIIQSGGNYSLKFSSSSDQKPLCFDTIVMMLGVRYRSYCSNLIRTILVDPFPKLCEAYELLLETEQLLIDRLVPGARLEDVYQAACDHVVQKNAALAQKMTRSFGFVTGIEFREGTLQVAAKMPQEVLAGMVLSVHIGFSGIVNENEKEANAGKEHALFLGDLVLVNAQGPATALTTVKKRLKDIKLEIQEQEQEEQQAEVANKQNGEVRVERTAGGRSLRPAAEKARDTGTEEKRMKHQAELAEKLNVEARERLRGMKVGVDDKKSKKSNVSYKNLSQIAKETDMLDLKLCVDKKYDTVILPIFGTPTPFHISTIKNVSQSVEGEYTYLRINFFHPGVALAKEQLPAGLQPGQDIVFVKEFTFRASNQKETGEMVAPAANLLTAYRFVKDVQNRFKSHEKEQRELEGIVHQEALVLSTGRPNPRLKDVFIRPNVGPKRMSGTLEAHTNGFRFTSIRGDKVDILYGNVKHAFFQPCDKEMIILIHLHLKNPILFGKKKQSDVQFYTEVGETITDLGKHHNMHDNDELRAEQAERELRQRLKASFKAFCERVEPLTHGSIEFDMPFRELGFFGSPFRSNVLLLPTASCLVQLTEWPPFVTTLDEVELVHFERVSFSLKNFDMVIIFKDYARKVVQINSVPMNMLDHVKEWLDSCDICYTEGVQSLNWPKIMKTILDDVEGFFEGGGWEFLTSQEGSEGGESGGSDSESEKDETYRPDGGEGVGDGDEEEEEDDDAESSAASEDDGDESEDWEAEQSGSASSDEDEESEEGKSWEELEREAEHNDRNAHQVHRDWSDEEEEGGGSHHHHRDRPMGGGARGRAPPHPAPAGKRTALPPARGGPAPKKPRH